MSDADYQRWEAIVERELLGEPVDAEELAFRREYEREHPECAKETTAWSDMLAGLSAEADAEGRTHAEALASRVLVQRDVEREVVRPLRPTRARSTTVRTAIVAAAAAAAVTAIVVTGGGDASPTSEASHAQATDHEAVGPKPDDGPPTPAVSPKPDPAPAPNAELGRLALAGAGVRIDGGPAVAGATIHAGQPIDFEPSEAARGSSACVVRATPWITTCFSEGSALAFTESEDGMAVELERGRVVVSLDRLPAGQRFSVVTSKGSVAAIGTSFEVWIDDRGTVRTSVLEGRVQVNDARGERALAAGQTMRLGETEVGGFGVDALAWSRAHVETARLWHHREPGVLLLESADDQPLAASVSVDALAVGHAPLSVLLPPGEHLVAQAGSTRAVAVEIEEGGTQKVELAPASSEPATGRAKLSIKQLVRLASQARGAHRYEDAARHLERILREYPDGPDAQNARVELADLSLDKLGNPNKALRLYDAYLSRGGPLTPEARHGRVRALERLGRSRDERAAIDQFLEKHPTDWRAKQLRARRDALGEP